VTSLLDAIMSESSVAVSRLADEDSYAAIDASDIELIEVPHIAGVPLDETIARGVVRVRHWPNLSGYLENGEDRDVVVWWPSLAPAPHADAAIALGPAQVHDTDERMAFLLNLFGRLEQHRGVSRVCNPRAARGIVYTPGIQSAHIDRIARRYPGSIHKTPTRLLEFPGGVCLTVTSAVWKDPNAFADSVDALIGDACRRSTGKIKER